MSVAPRYYVKHYDRTGNLRWMAIHVLAHGLFSSLVLLARPMNGRIDLGPQGLPALAVAYGCRWEELEPHAAALLRIGAIVVEGETLVICDYERDHAQAKEPAQRTREWRERSGKGPKKQQQGTLRDEKTSRVTTGDGGDEKTSRVTTGDGGDGTRQDQTRSDQTKQSSRAEAREGAPALPLLPDPLAQAIFEKLRTLPYLADIATTRHAEQFATNAHHAAKSEPLVMQALDELADKAAAAKPDEPLSDLTQARQVRQKPDAPDKSDANKIREDQTRSDQTKQSIRAEAREAAPALPLLPDPLAQAIFEKLRTLPYLADIATTRHAEQFATNAHHAAKSEPLVMQALDELADKAAAAALDDQPWNATHMGSQASAFIRSVRPIKPWPGSRGGPPVPLSPDMTEAQIIAEQNRRGVQPGAAIGKYGVELGVDKP